MESEKAAVAELTTELSDKEAELSRLREHLISSQSTITTLEQRLSATLHPAQARDILTSEVHHAPATPTHAGSPSATTATATATTASDQSEAVEAAGAEVSEKPSRIPRTAAAAAGWDSQASQLLTRSAIARITEVPRLSPLEENDNGCWQTDG